MSEPVVEPIDKQIAQLQAAIAAQETLRTALGNATVDAAIGAIRKRLDELLEEARGIHASIAGPFASPETITPQLRLARSLMRIPPNLEDLEDSDGERKLVTLLSADLSSLLSGGKLPGDLQTGLQEILDEISTAIARQEGIVCRVSEGSVLAVFGIPVSHEDDPERALRAALGIRHAFERRFDRSQRATGTLLSYRMGIHTGPVILSKGASGVSSAFELMGETVNVAARLEAAARPRQILASYGTFHPAREAFEFAVLEPIIVKGKREPLRVFELQQARLYPAKTRGVKGLCPAFAGREEELDRLLQAAADAQAGQGCAILVCGEAGMGKSRLLAEFRKETLERYGAQWLEGHAFAHTASLAYAPFIDLLRRQSGISGEENNPSAFLQSLVDRYNPDDTHALAVLSNLLAVSIGPSGGEAPVSIPAEEMRGSLLGLIEGFFMQITRQGPLWVLIEDLHWVDGATLELLEQLIPLSSRLPVIFLATTRPSDAPGAPFQRFQEAGQSHCGNSFVRLDLHGLSAPACSRMLEQLLQMSSVPHDLRDLVLAHADGNPFFIEEILRALIDGGALVPDGPGGGWQVTAQIGRYQAPASLHGLLIARLDRLAPETRRLAQQAAVIGRIFDARILQTLTGSPDQVQAGLEHLERAGIIRKSQGFSEGEYAFDHALTQEIIYSSLLAPRRRELHSQVGLAMETWYASRSDSSPSIIGMHFLRGEVWDKAYPYLLQAGDDAFRLVALHEARLHYASALDAHQHLPRSDDAQRQWVDLIVKLDNSAYLINDAARRENLLVEAEKTLRNLLRTSHEGVQDRRLLCQVDLALVRHYLLLTDYTRASRSLREGLETACAIEDSELITLMNLSEGLIAALRGQFVQSEALLSQVVDPLESLGLWDWWNSGMVHLNLSLAVLGRFAEATAVAQRVYNRSLELKSQTGLAQALCALLLVPIVQHDFAQALEIADRAQHSAEESRDIILTSMVLHFRAWAESWLGKRSEAARHLASAKKIDAQVGSQPFQAWNAALDAEIALNAGEIHTSLELAELAMVVSRQAGNEYSAGLAHRTWAQALSRLDPPCWEEIELHLGESLSALERCGGAADSARTRRELARACHAQGDLSAARRWEEEASEQFKKMGITS
jgi:class 3 adenylate cyclase/tetratricopeptide (TPR) repeat protein